MHAPADACPDGHEGPNAVADVVRRADGHGGAYAIAHVLRRADAVPDLPSDSGADAAPDDSLSSPDVGAAAFHDDRAMPGRRQLRVFTQLPISVRRFSDVHHHPSSGRHAVGDLVCYLYLHGFCHLLRLPRS